jgi:hypothetical protein
VFNNSTLEKSTVTKPPEHRGKDHGGGKDPRGIVEPAKRRKKKT